MDVIGFDEAETFPGLFQQRVARTPDDNAYYQYDAGDGVWKAYNWKQVAGNGKSESRMANRQTISLTLTVYQPT